MCSNAQGRGASFAGDFDTGCEYGWEIVSVSESKDNYVRLWTLSAKQRSGPRGPRCCLTPGDEMAMFLIASWFNDQL